MGEGPGSWWAVGTGQRGDGGRDSEGRGTGGGEAREQALEEGAAAQAGEPAAQLRLGRAGRADEEKVLPAV